MIEGYDKLYLKGKNKKSPNLSIKDKYILEEFVKDLESTYTVKEYIGKSKFENSCKFEKNVINCNLRTVSLVL